MAVKLFDFSKSPTPKIKILFFLQGDSKILYEKWS